MTKTVAVNVFKGLHNTADPLQLGNSYLTQADNLDISEHGRLSTRDGFYPVRSGSFSGAFNTRDFSRAYFIDSGVLLERSAIDGSYTPLLSGLSDAPMHWAEINRQVYFNNGIDSGVINENGSILPMKWDAPTPPDLSAGSGALPAGLYRVCCSYLLNDGRETGTGDVSEIQLSEGSSLLMAQIAQVDGAQTLVYLAPANSTVFQLAFVANGPSGVWASPPELLGSELRYHALNSLPDSASNLAFFQNKLRAMQALPSDGQTIIWSSQPNAWHLWDYADYIAVPGVGVWIAEHPKALIIATTTEIYAYDGDSLTRLATWGSVPGQSVVVDDNGDLIFWTTRGVCSALPFETLTEQVSLIPGSTASACLIRKDGGKKYVVSLRKGGQPFNARNPII